MPISKKKVVPNAGKKASIRLPKQLPPAKKLSPKDLSLLKDAKKGLSSSNPVVRKNSERVFKLLNSIIAGPLAKPESKAKKNSR